MAQPALLFASPETAITSRLPKSQRLKIVAQPSKIASSSENITTQTSVIQAKPMPPEQQSVISMPNLGSKQSFDRTSFHAHRRSANTTGYFARPPVESENEPAKPLPPAEQFAGSIILHVVEILLGHRPPRQIQTWVTPIIYDALVRRANLGKQIQGKAPKCLPPRIRRIHTCFISPTIAEVSVVLFDGNKTRAAALRLEARRQKWHVTALEII
ncbi:Rv3235 family protein [Arcanobacterium ihumii]|uniref:Rv3235 family protein n=1 Tax=Arcanobacterium ihumii TaxID=2138162 RepID=UPI000F51C1D8|nr:Rv3235 family protein [Arcanobacterium ihumii]